MHVLKVLLAPSPSSSFCRLAAIGCRARCGFSGIDKLSHRVEATRGCIHDVRITEQTAYAGAEGGFFTAYTCS